MHSSLYPYGERTLARVHRGQWLNPLGHKGQAVGYGTVRVRVSIRIRVRV